MVKRAGNPLNGSAFESHPVAVCKRSVRERLGENIYPSVQFNNKRNSADSHENHNLIPRTKLSDGRKLLCVRLRGDRINASAFDDIHLSKEDLRHTIMQKNKEKQSQNNRRSRVDLPNMLSRPSQSSTCKIATMNKMLVPKNIRPYYAEPIDARQHFIDSMDGRRSITVARDSNQYIKEYVHLPIPPGEQCLSESRESGLRVPQSEDVMRRLPETSSYGIMTRVNSLGPTTNVSRMDSVITSSSPWNLESLRRRSPDDTLATPRGLPVPTRDAESDRRFKDSTNDDTKMRIHLNRDALMHSRPLITSSYSTKMAPIGLLKTMSPAASAPLPTPVGFSQKSSYVMDDNLSVDSFLRSLDLERYAILLKAEEVDMHSLRRLVDGDLKEIGIPMLLDKFQKFIENHLRSVISQALGPRKKILLALHSPPERHA